MAENGAEDELENDRDDEGAGEEAVGSRGGEGGQGERETGRPSDDFLPVSLSPPLPPSLCEVMAANTAMAAKTICARMPCEIASVMLCSVTRVPPRMPWRQTAAKMTHANTLKRELRNVIAMANAVNPTRVARRRWACS